VEWASRLRRLAMTGRDLLSRGAAGVRGFAGRTVETVSAAASATVAAAKQLPALARRMLVRVRAFANGWMLVLWQLRTPVLLALGVGGTVAVACYLAGPVFAAAVGGLASAKDTLAARMRRVAREFGPVT
jgi:hypothetical protein